MLMRHPMPDRRPPRLTTSLGIMPLGLAGLLLALALMGCRSARAHREEADQVAHHVIAQARRQALGRDEPFDLEPAADTLRRRLLRGQELPVVDPASFGLGAMVMPTQVRDRALVEDDAAALAAIPAHTSTVILDLPGALQVAAANSHRYQDHKDAIFRAALGLDLERDDYRVQWDAEAGIEAIADLLPGEDLLGVEGQVGMGARRRFRSGMSVAGAIGLDLVKLLSFDKTSAFGLIFDGSIGIPLLRGSSRFVLEEPLRQAERSVIYAIYRFERLRQEFAVDVAEQFLQVLLEADRSANAAANHRTLAAATRRAERLGEAGRLPDIQVDQARQDALRARERMLAATLTHARRLDEFKRLIGLPVDADIVLDDSFLTGLRQDASTITTADDHAAEDMDPQEAVITALTTRLDLRISLGQVHDAARRVAIAADDLRADLTLLGRGRMGAHRSLAQAGLSDATLRPERGRYSLLLSFDPGFNRVAERNTYRRSWMAVEQAIRELQDHEDAVKQAVRQRLRQLIEARENIVIQTRALEVAERRAAGTQLFLEAGRAAMRDILEAQESLVSARNALTAALIRQRTSAWRLDSELGMLEVADDGLWPALRAVMTPEGIAREDQ